MTRFINRTVDVVFLILLALIVLAMAVSLAAKVFYEDVAYVVGIGLLAAAFAVVYFGKSRIKRMAGSLKRRLEPIPAWKLALFLGLFSAVTKIFLVFLFDNNADLHSDMSMYRSFAEQYAQFGKITEGAEYAYRYPYTAVFGLVLSPFAKIFGADTKTLTVALSVLHSVAMVLLFDMLKQYVKKEIAFSVLLLYCASPFGLLQTQLLLHENGLFFFHVVAFWLFERAFRENTHWLCQLLLVFAAAAVLSVGKAINAAGEIFFISFGIFVVAKCVTKKIDVRRLIALVSTIAILFACYSAGNEMTDSVRMDAKKAAGEIKGAGYSYPYGWSLYVGMNYESSGLWTEEDRATYHQYKTFASKEESYEYQKGLLSQRFEMYEEDPVKIPVHFFNKVKVLWGNQLLPFGYELGNAIGDFVLNGMRGLINKACVVVNNGVFLLIYIVMLIAQWKKRKLKGNEVRPDLHFRMAIIGVTLALLLFEVTPKYVSHLHICFFATFACFLRDYLCEEGASSAEASMDI